MGLRDNLPLVTANLLYKALAVGSNIVLQLYMRSLGIGPFAITLQTSVLWAGMLLFAPLWGAASDVSGQRRTFLAVGVAVPGLLFPVFLFTHGVAGILAVRFVFAAAAAAFPPVALAALSADADTGSRSRTLAVYTSSQAVGFVLGWGLSGVLVDGIGFAGTFGVAAAAGLVGLAAVARSRGVDRPDGVLDLDAVRDAARDRWLPSRRDGALRVCGLHYLYAGMFLRKLGLIGIGSLIAVYAVDVLGLSATLLGLLIALNPGVRLLLLHAFGRAADRYGRRTVMLVGMGLTVLHPALLAVATGPVMLGLSFAVIGVAFAAFVQGSTAFIGDVAPADRQGELMGFRNSAQGLAGVIGPVAVGAAVTVFGYRAMLWGVTGLTAASFLLVWYGVEESLGTTAE